MSNETENTTPATENKDQALVKSTFQTAVKLGIQATNGKSWGVNESMRVIRDLVELNENESLGFDMIEPYVRAVVNPNQFANTLAQKGKIERSSDGRKSRGVDLSGI